MRVSSFRTAIARFCQRKSLILKWQIAAGEGEESAGRETTGATASIDADIRLLEGCRTNDVGT
jgi:hypothetical protein